MKTTNVILIGVVGVGAVGAYMYIKNLKAQNALLSGSLQAPATSPSPATSPATSQEGFVATPATNLGGVFKTVVGQVKASPVLSTTSDGVSPSDANLNLANATVLVGQRVVLVAKTISPLPSMSRSVGGFFGGSAINPAYLVAYTSREVAKKQLIELDKKLATLGYKVDSKGSLVKI